MDWYALLPEDVRRTAYAAANGKLAWARDEALNVIAILSDNQCRVLGVDIWRLAPGGPILTPYCMDMSDELIAEGIRQAIWFMEGFNWNPEDPGRHEQPLFNIIAEFTGSGTRH